MREFISLLFIGIGLSMDTFSISLSIGALNIVQNETKFISILVGIFHFFMPLLGLILGRNIISYFHINSNYLLSIILIILGIKLLIDYFKDEEIDFTLNLAGIFLFALAVSLDSFSTGLGLPAITDKTFLATTIFSVCSFSFTYLGLILGKYTSDKIGKYATLIGIILLLSVAIFHLM